MLDSFYILKNFFVRQNLMHLFLGVTYACGAPHTNIPLIARSPWDTALPYI
nr:MAG TPA: hypothetical protein [Caudoviricetes sp.]